MCVIFLYDLKFVSLENKHVPQKKQWLEDEICFWDGPFLGDMSMFKGVNPCFWLVKSVDLHGSVGTHGSIDIRAGLDARSEAEIRYEVWDAKENYLEVQGPGPWS